MATKTCNTLYEPLIRAIAADQLGLAVVQLTPIPTYLDTIVYEIVTDRHAFIFKSIDPHSRDLNGIALEAWVCMHLAAHDVPAPSMVLVDTSRTCFPSEYFVMEKARGQPLSSLKLTSSEKQPYLQQLGRALQRLHAVQLPGFGWLDESAYHEHLVRGSHATWVQMLLHDLPAHIDYLTTYAGVSTTEAVAIERIVERMHGQFAIYNDGRLLHGDLGPLHVWVDPATQTLTNIVDFGDRMVGDPLWDFVDYDWDDVSALWSYYASDEDPSPIFGATFYSYALLRAIPWAHKWHSRGAVHVLDWFRITLDRATKSVLAPS